MSMKEIEQRVLDQFHEQGFMDFIGAKLFVKGPGEVEIEVPFHKGLTQQHGLFHGGVIATLADNASGFAGYSVMSEKEYPLSLEFKINFINKASGDKLLARAKVIKNGKRIKVCQTEVYCLTDSVSIHCATAIASIIATEKNP